MLIINSGCVHGAHDHNHRPHVEFLKHHIAFDMQPYTCHASGTIIPRCWIYKEIEGNELVAQGFHELDKPGKEEKKK